MQENDRAARGKTWLLLAIAFAVILRLYAAGTEDHQSPDSYQYARQSEMLRTEGLSGVRQEAARFLKDPAMAAVPSIARTVFLGALAGWMSLTETRGASSVAALSCFLDMVAAVLLALLASECLGAVASVAAVVLYAVSPAALCTARHGWSDSAVALLGILNLLLALRCIRSESARWPALALAVSIALSFGVKETAFLQGCLVLLTLSIILLRELRTREAIRLICLFFAATLAMLGWTAFSVGGLNRAVHLVGIGRDAHAQVAYAISYQTGTVVEWLQALWLSDPVLISLSILALALALRLRHRARPEHFALLACAIIFCTFAALPTTGPALYNVRWVTPIFAPACLLAAWGLRELWRATKPPLLLPVCVLALCAGLSLWRYEVLIARPDLQDLSLRMILTAHN